ncbi:hypothetical protein FCL47_22400 [Desulfopila sp. IMCC35006]|uniref:hypothetical protein n=1 Tax=Desulfopila sp. IMCC35006 TaxID=2569542 RepID=UPI0010AC8496|nr:hypothetical protein [Desulfopila sp. IMCC35006]TKB23507.1 hypothetical protein FCL47_22400 [Desulfopila sp. IMCC35006]
MGISYHPLPEAYKEILEQKQNFDLTIVGRDPYPTSPVGIPFCKESWGELLRDNCSGYHVLSSLGINLVAVKERHSTPIKLFEALAAEGIAFLNASYHFLDSEKITKKHLCYIKMASIVNKPIIEKSKACILCGQAKVIKNFIPEQADIFELIHPDVQNRKFYKDVWKEFWLPNILKSTFDLKLEI